MVTHSPIDLYKINLSTLTSDFKKNRNELRKLVIQELWKEIPGTGKADKASYYKYYVEGLSDKSRIYITRPAFMKQGFDFVIHVENKVFMNGKDNPKHDDIMQDLQKKKVEDIKKYQKLANAINDVFHCTDPIDVLKKYSSLNFSLGFSVDLILKVCKWFFIEQDIRYWNYSGRYMLKEGIDSIQLKQ